MLKSDFDFRDFKELKSEYGLKELGCYYYESFYQCINSKTLSINLKDLSEEFPKFLNIGCNITNFSGNYHYMDKYNFGVFMLQKPGFDAYPTRSYYLGVVSDSFGFKPSLEDADAILEILDVNHEGHRDVLAHNIGSKWTKYLRQEA